MSGRLLRANGIDFSFYKLAGWVNLTEQWPYRVSWIIAEIEDHEDIPDTNSLKTVYETYVHPCVQCYSCEVPVHASPSLSSNF